MKKYKKANPLYFCFFPKNFFLLFCKTESLGGFFEIQKGLLIILYLKSLGFKETNCELEVVSPAGSATWLRGKLRGLNFLKKNICRWAEEEIMIYSQ